MAGRFPARGAGARGPSSGRLHAASGTSAGKAATAIVHIADFEFFASTFGARLPLFGLVAIVGAEGHDRVGATLLQHQIQAPWCQELIHRQH